MKEGLKEAEARPLAKVTSVALGMSSLSLLYWSALGSPPHRSPAWMGKKAVPCPYWQACHSTLALVFFLFRLTAEFGCRHASLPYHSVNHLCACGLHAAMLELTLSARMEFIVTLPRDVTSKVQLNDAVRSVYTGIVACAHSPTTVKEAMWNWLILFQFRGNIVCLRIWVVSAGVSDLLVRKPECLGTST